MAPIQIPIKVYRRIMNISHNFYICLISLASLDAVITDSTFLYSYILAINARFARVRAARGWSQAYQGSCIDPTHQSHPLDPTWEVQFLRLSPPIRLLDKDFALCALLGFKGYQGFFLYLKGILLQSNKEAVWCQWNHFYELLVPSCD